MFGNRKKDVAGERLDELGRMIVRASAADASNEAEAEAVAAAPFLYTRLRSRIVAEQERRAAAGGGEAWLALLGVVRRSVPAMALIAVFAFILFWTSSLDTTSPSVLSDQALLDRRDFGIENVMFAERGALTSDDVLATMISADAPQESSR